MDMGYFSHMWVTWKEMMVYWLWRNFLIVRTQKIVIGRLFFPPLLVSLLVFKKMEKLHVSVCEQSD